MTTRSKSLGQLVTRVAYHCSGDYLAIGDVLPIFPPVIS